MRHGTLRNFNLKNIRTSSKQQHDAQVTPYATRPGQPFTRNAHQHRKHRFLQRKTKVLLRALARVQLLPAGTRFARRVFGLHVAAPSGAYTPSQATYFASFSIVDNKPEKDTSMPFTTYGNSTNFVPLQTKPVTSAATSTHRQQVFTLPGSPRPQRSYARRQPHSPLR